MSERITLTDSPMDMAVKLGEGNPGAISVLMKMLTEGEKIDPQCAFGVFGGMISLDSHGIYGHRIWMLYKDVCGEDLTKTLAVLRACQLGKLSEAKLQHAIDSRGEGVDSDALLVEVMEELQEFGRAE